MKSKSSYTAQQLDLLGKTQSGLMREVEELRAENKDLKNRLRDVEVHYESVVH